MRLNLERKSNPMTKLRKFLAFFDTYATEIAFYASLALIVFHPSEVTLGFATLAFTNFIHQRHCRTNLDNLKHTTDEQLHTLNTSTQIQLATLEKTLTDTNSRVQTLQVQKQITGRPAIPVNFTPPIRKDNNG